MTKQEVCNQIFEDMLDAGILNEVDFPNITLLKKEVGIAKFWKNRK